MKRVFAIFLVVLMLSFSFEAFGQRRRHRSFWRKHRDKITVATTTAAGAGTGAVIGGKKGALIGAGVGAGGGALYTYKLRKRRHRRRY
jgi:hypothetical protein